MRILPHCLIAALAILLAFCSRPPAPLEVSFVNPSGGAYVVRVSGLSSAELKALEAAKLDDTAWQRVLDVRVTGAERPVAGRYVMAAGYLDFVPTFPFGPGLRFEARFDPTGLPQPRAEAPVAASWTVLPGQPRAPTVVVTAIHPSAGAWPENLLRFYIHFSQPMSRASSVGFVHLVDDRGAEVKDALLEMDVDLWNDDRTRCTVFFDPGRVKRGIRPNRELGRALRSGRRYAIVVDAAWKDQYGQPLKAAFRHEFTAGPAIEKGISTADWRVTAPAAGTQAAVEMVFAWPLDRALAERTIGIVGPDGRPIAGTTGVEPGETRWRFVPASPWRAGAYQIVIDQTLEDVSGNQIGRAFEIDDRDPVAGAPRAERVMLPLVIKASGQQ
jgi:hypothetical protein